MKLSCINHVPINKCGFICRHSVKKTRYLGYREDPFIFLQHDDPMCAPVQYVNILSFFSPVIIFGHITFSALTLLFGRQEEHLVCKKT